MQKSPSCGLERVKVYRANGAPQDGGGQGIYAQAFCAIRICRWKKTADSTTRCCAKTFTRVFAYSEWQQLLKEGLTRRGLTDFHSRYKYLLMAHNPVQYKPWAICWAAWAAPTRRCLAPLFQRVDGGPEKMRDPPHPHQRSASHQRLLETGNQRRGQTGSATRHWPVPPRHRAIGGAADAAQAHFRQHPDPYIAQQVYLQPHPKASACETPSDERPLDSSASEDLGADFKKALDEGWLPIREVARQTGVNAITLRLGATLRPDRAAAHAQGASTVLDRTCARILTILTWLNRGVAVSQVKQLLDTPQDFSESAENDWQRLRQTLLQAVATLSERTLDDTVNQAMALYPPRTLCEQLLMPLLTDLEQRWQGQFGAQMERVFVYSWLRSKFGARIYHNNRQLHTAPLLLINHSDLPLEPHLWLTAWLISSADCPVEVFDWPLPAGELALAVDHLQPRGVLLYSSKAITPSQLPKLFNGVSCPKMIAGPTVCIHHAELSVKTSEIADLYVAEDPLAAHQVLVQRGLI
jgi:DNA-binding transcriptional MerR regulator